MPFPAVAYRWTIGIVGLIAFVLTVPFAQAPTWPELIVLAVLSLAAEHLLTINFSHQRALSFGVTFAITVFLEFGAATAVLIHFISWSGGQVIDRLRAQSPQRSLMYVVFNAGQLALCGVITGLVLWLVLDLPPSQPPPMRVLSIGLLVYSGSFLTLNVLFTTIAIWLRHGWTTVRESLWPNVSLWSAISFAFSSPLALFVVAMRNVFGFLPALLLLFALLTVLSYVIRITLRFQATNRELQVLNTISHTLASQLDLNDIYPAIYTGLRKLVAADGFVVGLLNADRTEMEVPFIMESGEQLAPRSFILDGTLTEEVLRTEQPCIIDQIEHRAERVRFGQSGRDTESAMFMPLQVGSRTIGMISVQSFAPRAYTPHQLELFSSIGRIASVAINNAQLFAREKDVLRGREEFISLVAHELKNPLAALLGHVQLLERRVRTSDERIQRSVATIEEQGNRMHRLVEDLLDLSRADTGRLTLHSQPLDMSSLVRSVAEQQGMLSDRHRIVINSGDNLPHVTGDALRLTQVLQNLLGNAIKYSPDGGPITIELGMADHPDPHWPRRVAKLMTTQQRWLLVRIKDHGLGIPEDQLVRIFDRFYRANNVMQTMISGHGLGLSVCEGLIKAHGGAIWAESEWGDGATFSFVLPVAES